MSQFYHDPKEKGAIVAAAMRWRKVGAQVIPVTEDGMKTPDHLRPDPTADPQAPRASWATLRTSTIPDDKIETVFATRTGLGVITGVGFRDDNLMLGMIEVDDPTVARLLLETAEAAGVDSVTRLLQGYVESTPRRGWHAYYWSEQIPKNTKLASSPAPPEESPRMVDTLIETRGSGGYSIVAPSHGRVHPSGNAYSVITGEIENTPILTVGEQAEVFAFFRHFDEMPVKEAGPAFKADAKVDGGRPGDDYNAKADEATFRQLLPGWTWVFDRGGVWYFRRPGKESGISATWNHDGHEMLKVFTSSTELESDRMYRAFSLRAQLQNSGNYAECAKTLAKEGFGKRGDGPTLIFTNRDRQQDHDAASGKGTDEQSSIQAIQLSESLSFGTNHCFYYKSGFNNIAISNFSAHIIADTTEEVAPGEFVGVLTLVGQCGNEVLPPIDVLASDFASMKWLATSGAAWRRAIVGAGLATRDKLRACIQLYSEHLGGVVVGHRHRETGWHLQGGQHFHTCHGGAIGPRGLLDDIDARLSAGYEQYVWPAPPTGEDLRAIASRYMRTFDLAPDSVLAPLLIAPSRAVLAPFMPIDFAIFLYGRTGVFKSELLALLLAHFGQGFTRPTIPLNFESTANSTEAMLWFGKDVVTGIDDYSPAGHRNQVDQLAALLERILRGIGNSSGRGRLNADASAKRSYYPRGMVIISGEEPPRGHSATARAQVVEVNAGAVSPLVLSKCQAMAREGVYAQLTSAFVSTIAANWDVLTRKIASLHTMALSLTRGQSFAHARTGDAVAGQIVAYRVWLDFIQTTGAIGAADKELLADRMIAGLLANALSQGDVLTANDPCTLFEAYIRSAVAGGDAHLASKETGEEPCQSSRFGWRTKMTRTRDGMVPSADEKGRRIGWVDIEADAVYLQPDAAFAVAQDLGMRVGKTIPNTSTTLAKRLLDAKKILSTEPGRVKQKIYVNKQAERVWHLRLSDLFPAADIEEADRHPTPFSRGEAA